ncbi:MAG: hypothetical protein QXQ76_00950 [Candidatus Bathyarchaeia archaeon]
MPRSIYRKRGGVIRYRTIVPKPGRYIHIAVVRKPGPRGGRTIAGRVHRTKAAIAAARRRARRRRARRKR